MVEDDANEFPYEFQSLDPEEAAAIQKSFHYSLDICRVGPKGYIFSEGYKEESGNIYNLAIKSDDAFVCSFPRSGTTWTQELVWLLMNDLDYDKSRSTPLAQRYTFLEFSTIFTMKSIVDAVGENATAIEQFRELTKPGSQLLLDCPSPRFIKTHMPLSLLPPMAIHTSKIVYVARDPRDTAVSFYHHYTTIKFMNYQGDFKTYWDFFTKSLLLWCPFFEHLKEAWALKDHPNMLFLFYEELSKDLPATVRRVADFLGKQLTEEQVAGLCDHLSFDNFKNNESVNLTDFQIFMNPNSSFVRKGKTGGWREYFDEEMSEQAARWIADNLRDTDLRFPLL